MTNYGLNRDYSLSLGQTYRQAYSSADSVRRTVRPQSRHLGSAGQTYRQTYRSQTRS